MLHSCFFDQHLIFPFEFREDFSVIDEGGNYDHWKYSVRYTEHLSHLPMIRNVAHGHYAVKPDDNGYVISSRHRTCFFSDFGCCKWTPHAISFARPRCLNRHAVKNFTFVSHELFHINRWRSYKFDWTFQKFYKDFPNTVRREKKVCGCMCEEFLWFIRKNTNDIFLNVAINSVRKSYWKVLNEIN